MARALRLAFETSEVTRMLLRDFPSIAEAGMAQTAGLGCIETVSCFYRAGISYLL